MRSLGAAVRPLRLIIVDDHADAGNSLGMLLRLAGHVVVVYQSGAAALDALQGFSPDAMILDLRMPGMSGLQLAERIRASSSWSKLPLIAVSANARDDDRQMSKAAGIDHHLGKPTDSGKLLRILADVAEDLTAVRGEDDENRRRARFSWAAEFRQRERDVSQDGPVPGLDAHTPRKPR